MNQEYVLRKIERYISNQKTIARDDLCLVFAHLPEGYLEQIEQLLRTRDITIEETSSSTPKPRPKPKKNLHHLSNEQLCILHKRGEQGIIEVLCRKNYGFIRQTAAAYQYAYRHKHSLEDLIQYGYQGFIIAIHRFDVTGEFKLISYAVHYVRQAIIFNIADCGFTVRIPQNTLADIRSIVNMQMSSPNISSPEIAEVLAEKDYGAKKVASLIELFNNVLHPRSISEPINAEGSTVLLDQLQSDDPPVDEILHSKQLLALVHKSVSSLRPRQQRIFNMRYGLEDGHEKTLQQIADEFALTRERVRTLLIKVVNTVRQRIAADLLETSETELLANAETDED